jgi:hypothetical protein
MHGVYVNILYSMAEPHATLYEAKLFTGNKDLVKVQDLQCLTRLEQHFLLDYSEETFVLANYLTILEKLKKDFAKEPHMVRNPYTVAISSKSPRPAF